MTTWLRFLKDTTGATAIEYGLIAALISVSVIAGLNSFSDSLAKIFAIISDTLTTAAA